MPCRYPPPGWEEQGDQSLYRLLILLLPRSTCESGLFRVPTDIGECARCLSLGPCSPCPRAEGLARQWITVVLTHTLIFSLLSGQWCPQPAPAWFPVDLSTLRLLAGRSCQPSALLVFSSLLLMVVLYILQTAQTPFAQRAAGAFGNG